MNEVVIAFGLKLTELEKKIDFIMAHTEGYKYDIPNPSTTTGALFKTLQNGDN